jgi:hypothetical protein
MVSSVALAKEDFRTSGSELRMAAHLKTGHTMFYTYIIESVRYPQIRSTGRTFDFFHNCLKNRRRMFKNCRMKTSFVLLLAGTLTVPSLTHGAATNAAPPSATNQATPIAITLPVSAAMVSAPLVLTNGSLSQPETTELAGGGKAVFSFTIINAGNYVIQAMVDAPAEDSNSFYVNVDAPPEDPAMIWDVDMTSGFEERTVSWRGKGTAESDEIVPKRFNLSAGAHKLIIVGREPAQLKSVTVRPAAN